MQNSGSTRTFRDLIAANQRQSALLAVGFVLFSVVALLVFTLVLVALGDPGALEAMDLATLGAVALGWFTIATIYTVVGYWRGDRMVLSVGGATAALYDSQLDNVVEEMAIAAGTSVPKIYLIEDEAPNAFATGRDPSHAAIAVTTGLLNKLTRDELQGVVAHELSHIRNYDTRLMLLLAVLVGAITLLSDAVWRAQRVSRPSSSRRESGNAGFVILIVGLLLAAVAPIFAQIIQLAVSREREYLADASAVELTRNPRGLADALRKIAADPDVLDNATQATAHLYIINPSRGLFGHAGSMFSSHPSTEERIRRLESLLV
ncbi:MAG: zinc metalloprotease HtpX [Chloroflexi bacterium]|nr:zinc metalloprotease HtpX [Chloroflexota bacterium]